MSQAKVERHKYEKKNRKKLQKKQKIKSLLWVFAGCIVLGGGFGFLLGKYWLYPAYRERAGYYSELSPEDQNMSDLNNQILQELNRQMEESIQNTESIDGNSSETEAQD